MFKIVCHFACKNDMEDTKKIAMKYKIMEILSPIELKNLSFKDLNFVCNLST